MKKHRKKVLLLSYYFPPLGMGGTQRIAKFVRYLPNFGWQPTIVTVKPIAYWAQDATLLQEIEHVRVIRTESFDPQRLLLKYRGRFLRATGMTINSGKNRAEQKLEYHTEILNGLLRLINKNMLSFFLLPDSKILWRHHAIKEIEQLLKNEHFDALLTTSPPHSTHLIGKKIARKYGLKWAADFRDSWTGGVVVYQPTFIQKWLHRRLHRSVIASADAIISVCDGIDREHRNVRVNKKVRFAVIPNGFDPDDYPKPGGDDKETRFVFCHCGAITAFSNPGVVLTALRQLLDRRKEWTEKILFRFVGLDTTGKFTEWVRRLHLEAVVEVTGYLPHRQALQYMADANALLLIAIGRENASFIPGKVFEYLGAQKPILAISNIKDTISLLQTVNVPVVRDTTNSGLIASRIEAIVSGNQVQRIPEEMLTKYQRKNQTKELADILNILTGGA